MKLDKQAIMEIIPHRDPILLLDEAEILQPGHSIRAWFRVPPDMAVLAGHFPGNPIFPGAYTMESIGQAAVVLALSEERYRGMTPLFFGTNSTRFFRPIRPGEQLDLRVSVQEEIPEKARITFEGECYVEDTLAASIVTILAIR